MSEDKKGSHHHTEEPPPHYGTFQGVVNHPPPTAFGFPPPPGASGSPPPPQSQYYARGYQNVPGSLSVSSLLQYHGCSSCNCGNIWPDKGRLMAHNRDNLKNMRIQWQTSA